jgi:hypothetical protein
MLRRVVLFAFVGFTAASLLYSSVWMFALAVSLIILMLAVAAWSSRFPKRAITPQQLADELETHLLGTGGPHDWDNTTSFAIADERLERLVCRLVPDFDRLDTPEKTEQLRQVIEVLRRGEVP